ncbi:unnamed protein product [Trifolium pratense]|uniref:Uncharacterized protein n=1 Tax=Trifolium pratense TaxID=57577 RepID=A0ACB0K1W3_TRIPR|nr:unnamed protein product [Trifolium pratense]
MVCKEMSSADVKFDDIADIVGGRVNVCIKAKVVRLVKVPGFLSPFETSTIEMVLADEKVEATSQRLKIQELGYHSPQETVLRLCLRQRISGIVLFKRWREHKLKRRRAIAVKKKRAIAVKKKHRDKRQAEEEVNAMSAKSKS